MRVPRSARNVICKEGESRRTVATSSAEAPALSIGSGLNGCNVKALTVEQRLREVRDKRHS